MTLSNKANISEIEILEYVLLMVIENSKEKDTPLKEALLELEENGSMTRKESKKILQSFKERELLINNNLTPLGYIKLQEAKNYFKI
jgi:hypothetical protein